MKLVDFSTDAFGAGVVIFGKESEDDAAEVAARDGTDSANAKGAPLFCFWNKRWK